MGVFGKKHKTKNPLTGVKHKSKVKFGKKHKLGNPMK